MKPFWAVVALLIPVCHVYYSYNQDQKQNETLVFKDNDIRLEHFNSTFPTIKNVRDNLVAQHCAAGDGLKKLYALYDQVDKPSSKKMITSKLQSLYREKERLKQQIRNLDAEVEKGVILKSFDNIEAGGIKKIVKQEIDQEYVKDLSRASRVNNALEYYLK